MNRDLVKNDVIVLGLGNPLMSDEGIGCFLVEHFLRQSDKFPNVQFLDAGTGGMSLLHLITERKKVILIDCACMGAPPGSIKRFTPDEVKSVKTLAHQSLHEADILKILDLAKQLKQYPQQVIIFGIEPENINPGQVLSEALTEKMDDYIAVISQELTLFYE